MITCKKSSSPQMIFTNNLSVQGGNCCFVVGLEDYMLDVVAVIPLFPGKMVKGHQHSSDPKLAGATDVVFLVILGLELLPLFGGQAFQEAFPAKLMLFSDGRTDVFGKGEGAEG